MKRIFSLLPVVLLTASSAMAQRQVETLNFDWQFSRDASFKVANHVDVPHDFQISQPWVAPSAGEKAYLSNISILVGINAHSISADCQKSALIDEQMDILTKKYGRALINDDADYQTLKNMIMDRIKTVKIQELIDMLKDSPYCL